MIAFDFADLVRAGDVERYETVAVRLAIAILVGLVISWARVAGGAGWARARPPLRFALMVLPVLVAMTMLIIADNVARAFGLVGALSIVRFRTFVEDTRDTVFIVFAVVAGMAAGAGTLPVCAVGVPVVALFCVAVLGFERASTAARATMLLEVRVALGRDAEELVAGVLAPRGIPFRLVGLSTARAGAASDSRYEVTLPPAVAREVVEALASADGVHSVELREP